MNTIYAYDNEQYLRGRKEARYQAAWAFIDGAIFNRSNVLTDGHVIYSYGTHFPMARKVDLVDGSSIAVNTDKYSATTSKHQSALRDVLAVCGYHQTDVRWDLDGYDAQIWTSKA